MDVIFPEAYSAKVNRYWRRSKYRRLRSSVPSRRKLPVLKLGGQDPDHGRRWKLKSARKLKLRVLVSPVRLLVKLRDAYVNMMLHWAKKMGMGRASFSKRKHSLGMVAVGGQQVDVRLVVEIYNRMVANRDQIKAGELLD
uniref:Uncharacterized protein n=1 Tax=Kalanchoe fedtschenkoi TaxID=63787 RepID=A0A7N0UDZ2_KALFE